MPFGSILAPPTRNSVSVIIASKKENFDPLMSMIRKLRKESKTKNLWMSYRKLQTLMENSARFEL